MNTSTSARAAWVAAVWMAAVAATIGQAGGAEEANPFLPRDAASSPFRTVAVTRGDFAVSVKATGTVQPMDVIEVGTQAAGTVLNVMADFGAAVRQGDVLARIDDAMYVCEMDQAKANCQRSEAELALAKFKLEQARTDLARVEQQFKKGISPAGEMSAAQFGSKVAEAGIEIAQAGVVQAQAKVRQAEVRLSSTVIRSPVDGVILDRRVSVGQTVSPAANAPCLFLVAKDLRMMQVWATVNEADIGLIQAGQSARFTVSAFPDMAFEGRVSKIRLNAAMMQHVVTYTVTIDVDNSASKLLPYLTADVQIQIARHANALLVPDAALRWQPQPQWVAPDYKAPPTLTAQGVEGVLAGPDKARPGRKAMRCVWVPDGKFVRPVEVRVVPGEGQTSEVTGGDLREGMSVVVGGGKS